MRFFYTWVFYAITPLVLLRLWWRGIKAPAYRQRWQERLGIYRQTYSTGALWFHAVSVGEAEAVFPLIRLLRSQLPDQAILVTTTTPTGSARVQAVLGDQVSHVYLPYDLPVVIERFLQCFRPKLAVFLEKELWPNVFAACKAHQVPVLIINARLSARSAASYQKIPGLVKPTLACVDCIASQTESDQQNFLAIGAEPGQLRVFGNIKFDMSIASSVIEAGLALKQQVFAGRWVWIAASTHHGEESELLQVYRALKTDLPDLLLLIVPRHPERFSVVEKLCQEQGAVVVKRSSGQPLSIDADVYLADSMGELKMLYAAADVAFVGGSLVDVGGHNVLEPAAIGVPVLFGPQMFNFKEIAAQILAAEAAWQCSSSTEIEAALRALYADSDRARQMVDRAKLFVQSNQGATQRIAQLIEDKLKNPE